MTCQGPISEWCLSFRHPFCCCRLKSISNNINSQPYRTVIVIKSTGRDAATLANKPIYKWKYMMSRYLRTVYTFVQAKLSLGNTANSVWWWWERQTSFKCSIHWPVSPFSRLRKHTADQGETEALRQPSTAIRVGIRIIISLCCCNLLFVIIL